MISNNELKYYSSLLKKKFRDSENRFIVEGKKSVQEGIESSYKCEIVFITNKFASEEIQFINNLDKRKVKVAVLKSLEFKKITDTKSPQGIAAVFDINRIKPDFPSMHEPLVVYLENISDPGNLGTIMRTSDWFGVKNIFLSNECSEVFNPKVIRSSMGSIFHIKVFENVKLDEIKILKDFGYEFLCSDLSGKNIYDFEKGKHTLLFLANESRGPSSELLSIADKKITIPGKGSAESLNVASASAIILSQLSK